MLSFGPFSGLNSDIADEKIKFLRSYWDMESKVLRGGLIRIMRF